MRRRDFERWTARRAHGVRHFVLIQGVLLYGLPMFAITTFLLHRDSKPGWVIAVSLMLWLLGGVAFGYLLWITQEWRYRRARARLPRTHCDGTD